MLKTTLVFCRERTLRASFTRVSRPGKNGSTSTPRGSSHVAPPTILRRHGVDSTVHGFRSSFRQWCQAENVPFEVAEAALAHRPREAVVRAYARSDYFDERRAVMDAYADYVCSMTGSA